MVVYRYGMPGRGGHVDVAVVGGGVAGLQAALTLGRACRRVVVFDDGGPRNRNASRVNNFLTLVDRSPADVIAAGTEMLRPYPVQVVRSTVDHAGPDLGGNFVVRAGTSVFHSRTVLLATGVVDHPPDVPGLTDLWGTRVVACPHCHGWEVRSKPLAQLAFADDPTQGVARAVLLSRWSSAVTFLANRDDLAAPLRDRLGAAGVRIRLGAVTAVTARDSDGVEVHVASGPGESFAALFTAVRQTARSPLARMLGCRVHAATGLVEADATGRTSVPGVWVAGSAADPALLAIGAAGHAGMVATRVHAELLEQELR